MKTESLPLPRMLKAAHVAQVLGVSARTVYTLIENGELPAVRVGQSVRIHPDALHHYVNRWRDDIVN